jgi:hypothetical protein
VSGRWIHRGCVKWYRFQIPCPHCGKNLPCICHPDLKSVACQFCDSIFDIEFPWDRREDTSPKKAAKPEREQSEQLQLF